MQTQLPQVYLIIFTISIAVAVLIQVLVLLGMLLAMRESSKKFHALSDEFRTHVLPVVAATRVVIDDLTPKVKVISADLVEITHVLRNQTKHANATVDDVLNKTTAQAARVNEMAGAVLDTMEHAAAVLGHTVAVPYRRASSVFAGLKAGLDVLLNKRQQQSRSVVEVEVPEEVIPR